MLSKQAKTYFNWSSGKDAALAFYYLQQAATHPVQRLLTSINSYHDRVSMHGLRRELLKNQIQALGLPVSTIELPEQPTMKEYNNALSTCVQNLRAEGFTHSAFGDIFLEDLREYREKQLAPYDIQCVFPLWKKDTRTLIHDFIKLGFKAITVCVKAELLDASFVGREIDEDFVKALPPGVDPCGENGEFHTFCYDGPIFSTPVKFTKGEKVYRAYKNPGQTNGSHPKEDMGFWFCDLLPA